MSQPETVSATAAARVADQTIVPSTEGLVTIWNRCIYRLATQPLYGMAFGFAASLAFFRSSRAPVIFGTGVGLGHAIHACTDDLRFVATRPVAEVAAQNAAETAREVLIPQARATFAFLREQLDKMQAQAAARSAAAAEAATAAAAPTEVPSVAAAINATEQATEPVVALFTESANSEAVPVEEAVSTYEVVVEAPADAASDSA
ncbi:hypothetical protein H696_01078 [Fonticula alba]|uniref:MICOS complex subunit n=1 Tax=Fonticula alba TaxID=691883 RepID=A0A058ZDX3_FONAL|nr:hypothetical protein, variant [Fonticula alba]XP_009493240.1 hypothetical protein H696_01078 [Fonticula alba]KCV71661.1 hypothetical protein H696_01078 [Fonticula alba]KCV71662.1 hypothetical protein, variant [Fonticula alba]|eukprot:XP_009493239.1 hypothetical protein, variant [Fonticula alba]